MPPSDEKVVPLFRKKPLVLSEGTFSNVIEQKPLNMATIRRAIIRIENTTPPLPRPRPPIGPCMCQICQDLRNDR